MMSTVTATARGTPSLTVAPSQNTAPVFEFRCLYTHDLRKKKKIWHDGSVRFHTFNRRVMVYDDSKNYIGDSHWRETGDFQEGEELKLDKGVVVEVGEQIGQTETDLAPVILEKRRPELASSPRGAPPSNTYSSGPRPVGAISQARPKSLAAVLGASQGPIGRARLPARSPFEHRQDNIRGQPEICEGRSAKRPRITTKKTGKENVVHISDSIRQVRPPAPVTFGAGNVRRNLPDSHRPTSLIHEKPLDSSEDLCSGPPSIPSRFSNKGKGMSKHADLSVTEGMRPPSTSILNSTARPALETTGGSISSATASYHRSKRKAAAEGHAVQNEKTNHAKVLAGDSATVMDSFEGKVTNKLRFAKEKPRKKLTYRDLLPHARKEKRLGRIQNTGDTRKGEDGNKERTLERLRGSIESLYQDRPMIDLNSEDEGDLPPTMQTAVDRHMGRTSQETLSPSRSALPSPSPLFVSQSAHSVGSTPSQQLFDEDFEPPLPSNSPSQGSIRVERTDMLQRSQRDPSNEVTDLEDVPAANDEGRLAIEIPQAPPTLTLLDQRLLQKSAALEFPSEKTLLQQARKQKSFRRTQSEGDPHVLRQGGVYPTEAPRDTADTTTACARQGHDQPPKAFRSPIKVQRSISDVTHLVQRTEVLEKGAPITAAVEATFDPWSEPEAYLLFDWWPPGKRKPSLVMSETLYKVSDAET